MATRKTTSASPSSKPPRSPGAPRAGAASSSKIILEALRTEAARAGAPLSPADLAAFAGPEPCRRNLVERCAHLLRAAAARTHLKRHPKLIQALSQTAEADSNLGSSVRLARRRGPLHPFRAWLGVRFRFGASALLMLGLFAALVWAVRSFEPADEEGGAGLFWLLAVFVSAVYAFGRAYRRLFPRK